MDNIHMEIILRKPVAKMLVELWGTDRLRWEKHLTRWLGFEVTLPKFFWEITLALSRDKTPKVLSIDCRKASGWMSVFYEYNLNRDLTKYIEITILRKCKNIRNNRGFSREWRKSA